VKVSVYIGRNGATMASSSSAVVGRCSAGMAMAFGSVTVVATRKAAPGAPPRCGRGKRAAAGEAEMSVADGGGDGGYGSRVGWEERRSVQGEPVCARAATRTTRIAG
jgi:hypothetical protein